MLHSIGNLCQSLAVLVLVIMSFKYNRRLTMLEKQVKDIRTKNPLSWKL